MDSMKRHKDMTPEDECPRLEGDQYATEEEQRATTNSSRKKEAAEPTSRNNAGNNAQLWMYLVVKVKSDDYKEQYFTGTWNIRSMNQGKLDMVKQEMARLNINILGISEIKWMRMGKFNSDDHYMYYCGQESLRRNGVALIVNRRVQNEVFGCNLKNDGMISVCFQRQTIQHHSNPSPCSNH